MSRTNADFSKHALIVDKERTFSSYHLKIPDSIYQNVKFTNIDNVLLVTGDLGNWVFCRPFEPSFDGKVSDGYWLEKLHINSVQDGQEFDSEATRNQIQSGIDGELAEYGYVGVELKKAIEYYENLLEHVEYSDREYISYAYTNKPNFMSGEEVPYVKSIKPYLKFVFDAFEEVCRRLKEIDEKINTALKS